MIMVKSYSYAKTKTFEFLLLCQIFFVNVNEAWTKANSIKECEVMEC